jgi:cytosine/adenosine deaminase-related metal-dependent hydrolase
MGLKKFKADKLFDGYRFLEDDKVLITDEDGVIHDIIVESEAGDGIQHFRGILSPGLINCHCHLELSHLKKCDPTPIQDSSGFCVRSLLKGGSPRKSFSRKYKGRKRMYDNGIAAVGDIGNTADTADVKSKSKIRWQNFVEVLSFTDEKAEENFSPITRKWLKSWSTKFEHPTFNIEPL